ncbi:MAG: ABC transporter ATP-binding protein [Acidimicrobiales bacterium]
MRLTRNGASSPAAPDQPLPEASDSRPAAGGAHAGGNGTPAGSGTLAGGAHRVVHAGSNGRAHPQNAGSDFVPMAVKSKYAAPKSTIDPDASKSWMRRAWPIAATHKVGFLTAIILSFVGLVLQVTVPDLLNKAVANSIQAHTVPLHFYVWWILGLATVAGVTGYISRLFLYKTAYRIEFDFRNIIYEHLTKMSFSFYDRVQSGQLISRANSDIRSVQMYMTFAPLILVQCSIALVAFGFMLSINVPLALISMVTMPFVYLVGVQMRKSLFPVSWLIQSRLADVATIVDENVNGVRVVKSFAAEDQQLKALSRAATKVQWGYVKDADLRARWTPAIQNLPQIGLVLVLLFGGWMVIHNPRDVGNILAFNVYLLMMQAPFMMLGMLIMMGQRAAASASRIYEILDERSEIVDRPGAVDLVDCTGDVTFDHVDFAYPGEDRPLVLAGFDLHLDAGETVALVGRTGSGKSTVARLLTRAYDVTGGAVRIDGHDVRDVTVESLRAHVGVVLDEPFLFSVSIRDNIAYGRPTADLADVEAAARAAGAHEFILELPLGYDTVVGERGYTLSGGQRQRIAIARTLLVNPPVLILDDATSAIDVQVEQQIHDALRQLMEGRTTLVIAHRLSTISLADRVILLEGGRVVADGTHAELLETSPLYAEVLAQVDAEAEAEAELLRAQPATASFRPTPTRDLAPPTMPGGLLS